MGIGLSICKEIIASHNGTIEIESESGKGTTVMFRIPVSKEGQNA
jgi:signal transduction histidine kinase